MGGRRKGGKRVLAHGYAVNISVEQQDGRLVALPEYQIVVQQGSATCYVESTPGKKFEISLVRTTTVDHDITAKVHLDGEDKRSVSRVLRAREKTTKMLGRRVSATEVRLFQFKSITTTEHDANSLAPAPQVSPDLGSIAIKIYRGTAKENTVYFSTDREDPVTSFDELSVKKRNTTEAAGLAAIPTPAVQARIRAFDYIDPPTAPPHLTFTFVYRSRAVLIADGIIREPSQAPSLPTPRSSANPAPSARVPRREVIEIHDSDDEEANVEDESQVVKDAKAAVAKAQREASIAEAALKAAQAASQQASSSQRPAKQNPPKREAPLAPPSTSILKKSKVVKQEPKPDRG